VSHQTAYLRTAILDLRANLEAKLRNFAAIEKCVERLDCDDPDPILIQETAKYLEAIRELHGTSSALLRAVDSALAGVVG
jgi:hypothetical protein